MKRIVNWAITNSPGMNVLVSALMLVGAVALYRMRREVFPTFELEIVTISVPYPGATPQDCEEAICQKIEEAIRSLDGIKKVTSIAQEGNGVVLAELRSDVRNVQKVMAEIDQLRQQMRQSIIDMPDEARANADAMRRVVSDQITALSALADVVRRHGDRIDLSGPGIRPVDGAN